MAQPFSLRAGSTKPEPVPVTGNPVLERYLEDELQRLWYLIQSGDVQIVQLEPLEREPRKLRDGMVAFFVGNVPNVGVPVGVYAYEGGAWKKL